MERIKKESIANYIEENLGSHNKLAFSPIVENKRNYTIDPMSTVHSLGI